MYTKHISFSQNKLDLYDQIVNTLSDEWDIEKGVKYSSQIQYSSLRKREFLSHIAFSRLINFNSNIQNNFVFTSQELLDEAEKYCKDKPYINPDKFIEEIKSNALLREISKDRYSFTHMMIHEYLAANILSKEKNITTIFCKAYFDPILCEMELLPMTIGLIKDTKLQEKIYEMLENLPDSLNLANLRLRLRSLSYTTKIINDKYLSTLILKLLDFIMRKHIDKNCYFDRVFQSFSDLAEDIRSYICEPFLSVIEEHNFKGKKLIPFLFLLLELNSKEAIPYFLNLLNSEDVDICWISAFALGKLNSKEAIPQLLNLITNMNSTVRMVSAVALGLLQAKEAIPQLLNLLNDEDAKVRTSSIFALRELNAKEAIPHLINLLKNEDAKVCLSSAVALELLQSKEAIPQLLNLLKDDNIDIRKNSIFALGELNAKEAIPQLLNLLKDDNIDIRKNSIFALRELNAKEAIPQLLNLLKDNESDITPPSAFALGELNAKEAIPQLLNLLKDNNSKVRLSSAVALGLLQAKEAIPQLINLLKDEDVNIRKYSAFALGELNAKEAIPQLLNLLNDEDESICKNAAIILGELNAKEAIPQLLNLLNDEDESICKNASESLQKYDPAILVEGLFLSLAKDSNIKKKAISTIGYYAFEDCMEQLKNIIRNEHDNEIKNLAIKELEKVQK